MKYSLFIIFFAFAIPSFTQKIIYSEPDRNDARDMKFEIIGKINSNILIYKATTNTHYINIFDGEMQLKEKVKLDFIPDKILNIDFLWYTDFAWAFYQYQKRNIIYNMAAKIGADGKIIGNAIQLDTTDSRDVQSNKIYSFVQSANKNYIMFFKVNSYDEKLHKISTFLYDNNLKILKEGYEEISMKERNSFLTGFEINNQGNLIFLKAVGKTGNDNISELTLISKQATIDSFKYVPVKKIDNMYLDEIKVKVDNATNRFIITSFYASKKRGDIQGLYISVYDADKGMETLSTITAFDETFRKDAKGDAGLKQAFNNYFIKNILPKKNGGFLLMAQSEYISTRNNTDNWNRWDAFGNPLYYGNTGYYTWNNPYGNSWNRYGNNSFNATRYYSDNIAFASIDSTGKIEWNNVLYKSQFDDNTDAYIGYGMYNAGNQLKILYNELVKQQLILNEQTINADGQINRSTTLKNLDKGYDFMAHYAKQVGARQIIIPCMYRSSLCFAKIDY